MIYASQGAPRQIGVAIAAILTLAWIAYLIGNLRRGRAEISSEIELAPNRKPYYNDEQLEGKRLERVQLLGLALLVVCGVGLPLYWVHEPGRQDGATTGGEKRLAKWGSELFAPTAEGGFNCAGCHGGMKATGGQAAYTITTSSGQVKPVNWNAPALNTVFYRFSEEELRYILVYGRKFSPMPAWGLLGGGPMNDQQIQTLIDYLKSIQLTPSEARKQVDDAVTAAMKTGKYKSVGEALFNMDAASGAYSCARCHTGGWSYGDPGVPGGGGGLGPNLTNGSEARQFNTADDNAAFISSGSANGEKYGKQGQGSGRMPGFGTVTLPSGQVGSLYTDDQIRAVVDYIRGL